MAQKEGMRWKRIGWLMLAGEVLLLLFLVQWLQTQYRAQEKRLHQDIGSLFTRTEEKLTDSLLNRTIAIVLNNPEKGSRKMRIQLATSFSMDTLLPKDSLLRELPQEAPSFHAMRVKRQWDTSNTRVKGITFSTQNIQEQLPEDVQKIFRVAIMQTANSKNLYNRGFSATADSATLFKTFQKELQKKQSGFTAYWDTVLQDTSKLFHYQYEHALTAAVAVKGYHPYLLRSILPQIGFSVVLLLLIGLAFWLAYRMLKQQVLFNRQKDSFISNISHELKTPVATTKVAIEALTTYNGLENPERTRKYLKVASWEMDRLSNMIDRIMNIIQSENGNLALDKKPIRLAGLVAEIVQTQQPILQEKGINVVMEYMDDTLTLPADPMHLQGVVYNLLDNAVKYGGNQIRIGINKGSDKATLRITDNGPGIPAEYHKRVFENFFRIPSDNRHDVKGHGLGLSYVRDVVAAHNGNISLESTPGKGATFIITLPLNPML